MEFLYATSLANALEIKASYPDAMPVAGGTDVMVGVNFGRLRPPALLDLTRVPELEVTDRSGSLVRIGAGVTYTRLMASLSDLLPGLAAAARTVGSPQIRNRGTIGGNLGTASPAGDCHPALLVAEAVIEIASVRGTRFLPAAEFFLGPKRNALEPDELITAVLVPPAAGPQFFAKVGTRNAMVIAVCSLALEFRPNSQVRVAIGSAGPTPLRATAAEEFLAGELAGGLCDLVIQRFGELVAAAAEPIDDVRGTADYRRHALAVLARRTLTWAWQASHPEAALCG
jgi:CO/xanthine dehydrogenase FAD-binding subunit